MYSRCFVCNNRFGSNEALHYCPLGQRVAFEPAAGRLWIVCGRCSQWCLVPLESRWEALQECESLFSQATARVSTENIGLCEVTRSFSLIRVGSALRDELANWRYGDRIRRRKKRIATAYAVGLGGMASVFAAGAVVAGNPIVAGWLGLAFIPYGMLLRQTPSWQRLGVLRHVGGRVVLRRWDLPAIRVNSVDSRDIAITVDTSGSSHTLRGGRAVAFLSEILPRVNWDGGSEGEIRAATREVDDAESGVQSGEARNGQEVWERIAQGHVRTPMPLMKMPVVRRLALEMAVTEEMERRAIAQEAVTLAYIADRESNVAAIADNMFLPAVVNEWWIKLRRKD